ncbi:transglycosylase domain-containing protein [Treponema sp. OttesenSCG-928-L16]|nr:transglycosylase domain-containing protein [Treponema sp. OttesenSCG-928-L16]
MFRFSPRLRRLLAGAAVLLCGCFLVWLILFLIPYPELDAYRNRSRGIAMYDRHGRILRVLPADDGVKREWTELEDIPAGAVRIFIKAEDRRFYFHGGIDPLAVAGSLLRNIRAERTVSGASTITMQLARLIRPRRRGMGGKIAEAWDALRLEARLTKKEILELWLNGIPFGSNMEGIAAAARARFGIPVGALDDSRALLLAVIPRRPGYYDPVLNPGAAVKAALALAERSGIAADEASIRRAADAAALPDEGTKAPFRSPHFTERLASELRKYPSGREAAENAGGGIPSSFATTLDLGLQTYAEHLLEDELSRLLDNRVTNGAILAIENSGGAVRVYAGSRSWFDESIAGKIDGVQVRNQPGSCLKPFLYALALDRGFSAADVLPDIPTVFGGSEAYVPGNFTRRFNGPVRFRVSLASSLNVPAVYLLERLGVNAFENYLVSLGFDSILDTMGTHGTGLALGNAEVSLEELVRAFSAFPRGGVPAELRWYETPELSLQKPSAQDRSGRNAADAPAPMSPEAAWLIGDILSDRASRFVGFGPAPSLANTFSSMYKTGTANQFQHIWALGSSRRFTVGVWMGNFSGETVVGRTGSSIPARIVSALLEAMEESSPEGQGSSAGSGPENHAGGKRPASLKEIDICSLSGEEAGPFCGGTVREWVAGNRTLPLCSWHPGNGETLYPADYQAWLSERFHLGTVLRDESGGGRIRLPVPGSVFYLDPSLSPEAQAVRVETAGFSSGALVWVNDALQGSLNPAGIYMLPLRKGKHIVRLEDELGSAASVEFEVR